MLMRATNLLLTLFNSNQWWSLITEYNKCLFILRVRLTTDFIVVDWFQKATDDEFSKSLVNVSRTDRKVTCLIVSATVLVCSCSSCCGCGCGCPRKCCRSNCHCGRWYCFPSGCYCPNSFHCPRRWCFPSSCHCGRWWSCPNSCQCCSRICYPSIIIITLLIFHTLFHSQVKYCCLYIDYFKLCKCTGSFQNVANYPTRNDFQMWLNGNGIDSNN